MPLLNNAKKALRASERKATINRRIKSQVKTAVDKVKETPNPENMSSAFSALDKAVKRGLFHINKVARLKSQLSRLKTA
jgi:ribosomal protein S20